MSSKPRKQWLILAIFLILWMLFAPPYTSKGRNWTNFSEIPDLLLEIGTNAVVFSIPQIYPIFKITPIILVLAIIFLGNRVTSIFSVYTAVNYIFIAFLQNTGITEEYGLGIMINILVPQILIAIFWFREAFAPKNDFTPVKQSLWKYWMVPLAFLSFWYPINMQTGMPDFNPVYLITNYGGLAFCLVTPVYLSILILHYPRVNIDIMIVMSLIGAIVSISFISMMFLRDLSFVWWNMVLHVPLLTISLYALFLSLKRAR